MSSLWWCIKSIPKSIYNYLVANLMFSKAIEAQATRARLNQEKRLLELIKQDGYQLNADDIWLLKDTVKRYK